MDEEQLNALLSAALFRKDCPDTMILSDLEGGFLDETRAVNVQLHIDRCRHCQEEWAELKKFVGAESGAAWKAFEWQTSIGYRWTRLKEGAQVVVEVINKALSPETPSFVPASIKGKRDDEDKDILRHIYIPCPDEASPEVDGMIRQDKDNPELATLYLRAEIPDRWPNSAGLTVIVQAGEWRHRAVTDDAGMVTFTGMPVDAIESLVISVDTSSLGDDA
jgi:hypothetical protein